MKENDKLNLEENLYNPPTTKPIEFSLTPVIRIVGVFVLFFGLWMGYQIVSECWGLFDNPSKMNKFGEYVEEGSGIDEFIQQAMRQIAKLQGGKPKNTEEPAEPAEPKKVRISYLMGWFITFLLFLVMGKIAFWAIKTGGELAMHQDSKEGEIAKQIAKEILGQVTIHK